ncbi:YdiK family protein [Bacillus norwichensis]|uniref:YdiK family protein n=1 Tax=Bacillus norwichensis TaxID=2762217 RepID=A0ABR8VQW5_9BACI|nr:YdiK family protein [Bacillus norwichensis]MBD8007172.1 YdiK family protein [Bacillus norwichensis]
MRSPLFSGLIYITLGVVFTFFAVQQVKLNEWGFMVYLLIVLATFDFGAGFRMISLHFRLKNGQKK